MMHDLPIPRRPWAQQLSPYLVPAALALISLTHGVWLFQHPDRPAAIISILAFLGVLYFDRIQFGWEHSERRDAARQTQLALRVFILSMASIISASVLVRLGFGQNAFRCDWSPMVLRARNILLCSCIMLFGNWLPKLPSPWHYRSEPFDWQGVHRFAGTVLRLSGIFGVFVWLIAPIPEAKVISKVVGIVISIMIVARKWLSLATWTSKCKPN